MTDCDVPGCGRGIHAGSHGPAVPPPTTTYCAPLRCYCGRCPSWTPPDREEDRDA